MIRFGASRPTLLQIPGGEPVKKADLCLCSYRNYGRQPRLGFIALSNTAAKARRDTAVACGAVGVRITSVNGTQRNCRDVAVPTALGCARTRFVSLSCMTRIPHSAPSAGLSNRYVKAIHWDGVEAVVTGRLPLDAGARVPYPNR
jgi:hypothetical protein